MAISTPTPSELLAFLKEHGFLSPSQSQQFDGDRLSKYANSPLLARELIDRKLLTAYQANQLLQGKGSSLLLGPYRLLKRLGEGGMGQVFKARHINMDRVVALKIIANELVSNSIAVSRFYREARAVAKLSHSNIVAAYEANQIGETHYLAMEYVKGIDLARLIQQSGPLAIPQACEYILQAAIGLQHAHETGLVHRDIKPGNLIVTRPNSDKPPVIKILDFGLARFESESERTTRLTQLGQVVGTVDYVAPEQSQNSRMADIRADIYSLGCSLFYLLTGNPPFPGDDAAEKISARVHGDVPSVRKSRPEVSPALEQVLAKMTARNPADRYQTPGEVAKALKPHSEEETEALSQPTTLSDRPVGQTSKRQTVAIAHEQTTAQLEAPFPSMQPNGRLELSKRVKSQFWIVLAGALVLLVALIGAIVFAFKHDPGASRKGQLQLAGAEEAATRFSPVQPAEQSPELAPNLEPKPPPLPEVPRRQAVQTTPANEKPAEPAKPSALDPQFQATIDQAIDSGVAYLKRTQQKNGTWANPHGNWAEARVHGHIYAIGFTALPALTLLECGMPATDPSVQQAAQFVRSKAAQLDRTYELALAILFLDRLGDPKDKKIIQTFALRLIAGQSSTGGWGYKCPILGSKKEMELLTALRNLNSLDDMPGIGGRKAKKPSQTTPTLRDSADDSTSLNESDTIPPDRWRDCLGWSILDEGNPELLEPDPKEKDGQNPTPAKPDAKADSRRPTKSYVIPERIKMLPVVQDPEMHVLQDPLGRSEVPTLATTDNSNTQFAILALWRAQQYDVPTKRSLNLIVRRYLSSQNADGSWGYHFQYGGGGGAIQLPNSMICVGLIGLAVGHGLVKARPAGQPAQDTRIINGLIALSAFIGQPVEDRGKPAMQNLYFLWSLERVAVLYNLPTIGDKDWYRWGAQVLVRNQQSEGHWTGGLYIGSKPTIDTCLALLFLKRANLVKDLTAKLPFSAKELNNSIILEKIAPKSSRKDRSLK